LHFALLKREKKEERKEKKARLFLASCRRRESVSYMKGFLVSLVKSDCHW
jgi:hypothetical protein